MNEPVDKMLTSRIRQVFEEFEDHTADAGWEALRKKYPERNRRPLILWLSSAAALMLIAAGLWFTTQTEQLAVLKPAKEEKTRGKKQSVSLADTELDRQTALAKKPTSDRFPEQEIISARPTERHHAPVSSKALSPGENTPAMSLNEFGAPQGETQESDPALELPADMELSKAGSPFLKGGEDFPFIPIDPVKKPVYVNEFNPKSVETEDDKDPASRETRKLTFSVFAGSYFNYSEGSENQLNFGAGFVSDIRLSKNLKVSTGVSIASNSLNYDSAQDLPVRAYASFKSAEYYSGNLTTITSYNASLLALDIPLNLKYQFIAESDKFYLSAGLSSGTYLNETYAYQYRNFSTATGSYASPPQDQKIKKQLNDFDLGRTLNLSLGISTGFGKTQVISIEPFMKYPLSGLGSEDLRFGSAGINLKLRFAPQKK